MNAGELINLVQNPGFESGDSASWTGWGAGTRTAQTANAFHGTHSGQLDGEGAFEQVIPNLTAGAEYVLLGFGRVGTSAETTLGVTDFGGTEVKVPVTDTTFRQIVIPFQLGAANTSAKIYNWNSGVVGTTFTDDFVVTANLLPNGGFETGNTSGWTGWGAGSRAAVTTKPRRGTYCGQLDGEGALERVIDGLKPNTNYLLSAHVILGSSTGVTVGVADFGNAEQSIAVSAAGYHHIAVPFTTGATHDSAKVYMWNSSGAGSVCGDEFAVIPTFGVPVVSAKEGPPEVLSANFVKNAGFERGDFGSWVPNWGSGTSTAATTTPHTGTYCGELNGQGSIAQTVNGLAPDTNYAFIAWSQLGTATDVRIGVKDFGFPEVAIPTTGSGWKQTVIPFRTGAAATEAQVYAWNAGGTGSVCADDFMVAANIVRNFDFEDGTVAGWVSPYGTGAKGVSTTNVRSGTYCGEVDGEGSLEQVVSGLLPSTKYLLLAHAQLGTSPQSTVGVKDYGGDELKYVIATTTYDRAMLGFTTGAANTSARVYLWNSGLTGTTCLDDVVLVRLD